jgi:membrane-bound serine protease (ClpP class)
LRPSGKVRINDEIYDARAMEGYSEKDEEIKVLSYSSGQLNVRKIK